MYSQVELVSHLCENGVLRSKRLIEAFLAIDRADFVPNSFLSHAYKDYPLSIGYDQTISQPYTVAFMLEALKIAPDDLVLDIGAGSGWTTALMASIAKEVIGLERIKPLVSFANTNLQKYSFSNATVLNAGAKLGIAHMQFDKILVSAAASSFPTQLLDQLRPNGILVIPVNHAIVVYHKEEEGKINSRTFNGFVFVPLITTEN